MLTFGQGDLQPENVVVAPIPAVGERDVMDLQATFVDDLGTGSTEFSAIALNEQLGRVVIADDEGQLFEFELDDAGVPVVPPRRTVEVTVGSGDIEGVTWMFGTTYALADEGEGVVFVIDLGDAVRSVSTSNVIRTVDTGVREIDGNGIEGVAFVQTPGDIEFVVVDERPPTLYSLDRGGEVARSIPLAVGVLDASDIWVAADGVYSVLSDESATLVEITIDPTGEVRQVGQVDLTTPRGQFSQAEGVVRSADGTRLYVVGERPGPGSLSLAYWRLG